MFNKLFIIQLLEIKGTWSNIDSLDSMYSRALTQNMTV